MSRRACGRLGALPSVYSVLRNSGDGFHALELAVATGAGFVRQPAGPGPGQPLKVVGAPGGRRYASGGSDTVSAWRAKGPWRLFSAALALNVRRLLLSAITAGLAFAASLSAQVPREPVEALSAAAKWLAETYGRVDVIDGMVVLDGDMVLGDVADVAGRTGPARSKLETQPGPLRRDAAIYSRTYESVLWPSRVIPYVIGDGFSDTRRDEILTAINEWNERTVISLVARKAEEEYVLFQTGGHCQANVGRLGLDGVTNVWLASSCSVSSIVHEIGHAVGLGHEHQRLDRNAYLDMRLHPSPETSSGHISSYVESVGIERLFNVGPYDFRSVMNYSRELVPVFGGIATYETVPPGIPVENQSAPWLSEGDIDGVARLYGPAPSATVIATNPRGLGVIVDGTVVTGPASFDWPRGSVHTIEAPVAQQGMVFARWNAGGARVRQVIAGPELTWFEANYASLSAGESESPSDDGAPKFRLWTGSTGDGSIVADPPSEDGYYHAGTRVALTAQPGNSGGNFRSWEGTATSYEPTTWVDMDGPKVVILHWESRHALYWRGPLDSTPDALQIYSSGRSDHPPTQTVRLSNEGDRAWRYRVVSDQPWLSARPARGSVEGNGSAEIAVRFHSDGLPPGRYAGRLQFLPLPEDGRERKVLELAGVPVELIVGDEPGAAQYLTVRLGQSGEVVEVIHVQGLGFLHRSGRPLDGNRVTNLKGDTFAVTIGPDGAVGGIYVSRTQVLELADGLEVTLTKDREGLSPDAWRVGQQRLGSSASLVRDGREYFLEHVVGGWRLARYLIHTVAGNAQLSDGTLATSASLSAPSGVTLDALGNLYLAESSDHRIRKIDPSGVITTVAGSRVQGHGGDGGPAVGAQLNSPQGVAADAAGNVYIADTANNLVRKTDASGTITTLAGSGAWGYSGDGGPATMARLRRPVAVAADAVGSIYIADAGNDRVRKVDASGTITTVAGTGEADYGGDGGPATEALLNDPRGVAVDALGNVYIADTWNNRVRKIDTSGTITTVAGTGRRGYSWDSVDSGPATEARIGSPHGVAVDALGNLYVAERWNNRVRRIDVTGTITTVAGTGNRGFGGDGGPATAARLNYPTELVADEAGNIYIADEGNDRVRKINSSGTISTISGSEETDDGPHRADSVILRSPRGATLDPAGNLLFIDGPSLWKLDPLGGTVSRVSTVEVERWDSEPPFSVTADSSGNVYVLAPGRDRFDKGIVKFDASGGAISSLAQFDSPESVTADGLGNVYVVDYGSVYKINGSGAVTSVMDDIEAGWASTVLADRAGNLYVVWWERGSERRWLLKIDTTGTVTRLGGIEEDIEALAADSSGNLYFRRQSAGSQIWKLDAGDGAMELIAGTGEPGFDGDGSGASNARLWVSGIAADSSGNVWFTDHRNRRVRVLKPLRGGVLP